MTSQTWILLASFLVGALSVLLTPASCFSVPPIRVLVPSSTAATTAAIQIQKRGGSLNNLNLNIDLCNHNPRNIIRINSTNKDDEIAELEAKLRQLKEEKDTTDSAVATTSSTSTASEINGDTPVATITDDAPLDEMLSEAWKESDSAEKGGSIIPSLIGGLVLLIAFVALSQVPVGQEGLDKYSTPKPSTSIDLGDKNPSARIEIN